MQDRKKLILLALAKTLKKFRNNKSLFTFSSENDISISIVSTIERGLKDPQLTTLFKIAEALNISLSEFIKEIEKNLPKDFSLIEK